MKLSTAFPMAASLAFTCSTHASEPNGAVFSNINRVQDISPQAVWQYLANCADVTEYNSAPEGADCLFEKYINEQFPNERWGDVCAPPHVSAGIMALEIAVAANQCPDFDDHAFVNTAINSIATVLSMDSCWAEICDRDDSILRVESAYIESCAGVELPYPVDAGMFLNDEKKEKALVTCMLNYVMESPASEFGMEEPSSSCYPPGYQNMNAVCETLAPKAFEHCANVASPLMLMEDGMSMSFDYEMSMKMEPDVEMDYFAVLEKFCGILERVTTDRGLQCLDEICDNRIDPSVAPSHAPSTAPSLRPSAAPSAALTTKPSMAPSASPSSAPSMEDSDTITNPEVVDSSAVHAAASILSTVSLILAYLML